ncbi:NAD(P)H-dependent flavin oxidoreductase [Cetobacterium sp.]|uniref:NAD(P)H-dependent flavin oxidoreductase n=1 Tax=Cetobacterium sp. TaxID=2071632 RepID=UPI002FC5B401
MKIGDLNIEVPIIQGGMGIRASMSRLASAVANQGGVGVISGTAIPAEEFRAEIRKAKEMIIEKGGALGVNIMVAASNFAEAVKVSIEEKVDMIICGAGFSRDIFETVKGTGVKIVPIVSSLKLAKIAEKLGADAIVVEGGNAGGHLGTDKDSWDIVEEIVKGVSIPVFGAGGVITPEDAERMMALGEECEVSQEFKEMYVNSKEGDVVQIMSSAGLPANAIISPYVKRVINEEKLTPKKCTSCLKKCSRKFCVKDSLIKGHEGDSLEGIFFAGKDAWKINEILSVKEVFDLFRSKVVK